LIVETGCVFCAIVKGDESTEVIYGDGVALAAMGTAIKVARAIEITFGQTA
jgi:hypothetical protein